MIMKYSTYLKESLETEFKIGDKVFINGTVDDEVFNDVPDTIGDISNDKVDTNMNENGKCKMYSYRGIVYYCVERDWWVSPFNLRKVDYKREVSERDPYGEENWETEEEITEAKKQQDLKLVTLTGQDFHDNPEQSIAFLMNHDMTPDNRARIEELINRNAAGKKVLFINRKYRDGGTQNLRKERIIKGAYWHENLDQVNFWRRWELYLVGTKKDYLVNTSREMGYYTDVARTISPIDPYGEEIWD